MNAQQGMIEGASAEFTEGLKIRCHRRNNILWELGSYVQGRLRIGSELFSESCSTLGLICNAPFKLQDVLGLE